MPRVCPSARHAVPLGNRVEPLHPKTARCFRTQEDLSEVVDCRKGNARTTAEPLRRKLGSTCAVSRISTGPGLASARTARGRLPPRTGIQQTSRELMWYVLSISRRRISRHTRNRTGSLRHPCVERRKDHEWWRGCPVEALEPSRGSIGVGVAWATMITPSHRQRRGVLAVPISRVHRQTIAGVTNLKGAACKDGNS
jgi:hypothetical protein